MPENVGMEEALELLKKPWMGNVMLAFKRPSTCRRSSTRVRTPRRRGRRRSDLLYIAKLNWDHYL